MGMPSRFLMVEDPAKRTFSLRKFASFLKHNIYYFSFEEEMQYERNRGTGDDEVDFNIDAEKVGAFIDDHKIYGYFNDENLLDLFEMMSVLKLFAGSVKLFYKYIDDDVYYMDTATMSIVIGGKDYNVKRSKGMAPVLKDIEEKRFEKDKVTVFAKKPFETQFKKIFGMGVAKHLLLFLIS